MNKAITDPSSMVNSIDLSWQEVKIGRDFFVKSHKPHKVCTIWSNMNIACESLHMRVVLN